MEKKRKLTTIRLSEQDIKACVKSLTVSDKLNHIKCLAKALQTYL